MIRVKAIILAATVLLLGLAAWAQEFPIAEVTADYTYARDNPSSNYSQPGSLNGGGGSYTLNLNQYLGIKADLQGYGSTRHTFNIPQTPNFPNGATGTVEGNLFTYMFGPELKLRLPTWQPFFHTLFGGAHTNVYANAESSICNGNGVCKSSSVPSNNAFAASFGGGLDIKLDRYVAFMPVEIDYVLTRFNNEFTSNQHTFRYAAGIVFSNF